MKTWYWGPYGMSEDNVSDFKPYVLSSDHLATLETLKDANVVHVNMLRGQIARLTPAQIAHLYSHSECAEIIAEIKRQRPEAALKIDNRLIKALEFCFENYEACVRHSGHYNGHHGPRMAEIARLLDEVRVKDEPR